MMIYIFFYICIISTFTYLILSLETHMYIVYMYESREIIQTSTIHQNIVISHY